MSRRSMRHIAVLAALVLTASAALAADPDTTKDPQKPDFSRDTLIRIFADNPEKERVRPNFEWGFGYVDFRALGMRWRISPLLMPLQGSRPWLNSERWPDPFLLTGTEIASPPRTWRQTRDMNAELRRIEKKVKEAQRVTVKPQ